MSSRDDVLARIRAARPDVPGDQPPDPFRIPRTYQTSRTIPEGLVTRFCERVAAYRAEIEVVAAGEVPATITKVLTGLGARRVAYATGLPQPWRTPGPGSGLQPVSDDPNDPLGVAELQRLDAVVTAAAVGIAQTGTVVLDGSAACGRRALTLVPDAHVCLVAVTDIVDDVCAAVALLSPRRPLTWVSGPSATSDIELNRVEGVHGPRRLYVLVVTD
jgi:L-lactate dehydrogenase complex protein LldG